MNILIIFYKWIRFFFNSFQNKVILFFTRYDFCDLFCIFVFLSNIFIMLGFILYCYLDLNFLNIWEATSISLEQTTNERPASSYQVPTSDNTNEGVFSRYNKPLDPKHRYYEAPVYEDAQYFFYREWRRTETGMKIIRKRLDLIDRRWLALMRSNHISDTISKKHLEDETYWERLYRRRLIKELFLYEIWWERKGKALENSAEWARFWELMITIEICGMAYILLDYYVPRM